MARCLDLPISISSANSKTKGAANVEPKALSKFSSDWGNSHCSCVVGSVEGKCRVYDNYISHDVVTSWCCPRVTHT